MNGGLMKTSSHFALTLVAGLAFSASAFAADLGGNCCADLEERIAELEATTARKGNRKVSLTVYGWVNKAIMAWDDGARSNVYLGQDNTSSATRIGFRGNATINSEWKAGYSILMDWSSGARTATSDQLGEEKGGNGIAAGFTDDAAWRIRDANVYLESSRIGRVTLGRLTLTGPQGTIDLGEIGNVASGSQSLIAGGLFFRNSATNLLTAATIGNVTDATADYGWRTDGVRWESPTWAGFVLGASIGEATKVERVSALDGTVNIGRTYGLNVKYANEFNGVRVAAAAGIEVTQADETGGSINPRPDSENYGYSLSLLHTATGLFAQGHYMEHIRGNDLPLATEDKAKNFMIQAGLTRNYFGIGNTAIYGEYSSVKNGFDTFADRATLNGVIGDKYTMWGLGVTQNIDAAAMQLFAGYRNHSLDFTPSVQDISVFSAGMRINF
jgi:hypothetical protein